MAIIQPENENWNSGIIENMALPFIYVDDASNIYLLIQDISEDLAGFIRTGKTKADNEETLSAAAPKEDKNKKKKSSKRAKEKKADKPDELHVLSEEQELKMYNYWRGLGMSVTYRRQRIEYMYRRITVIYPQISKPGGSVIISVIPWFMRPARPYPTFVYLYATWHYVSTGQKSMEESAKAAGKVFKISSFNKSTISRNIKAMEEIIGLAGIDMALPVDEPATPPDEEILRQIPEILNGLTTVEMLKDRYGNKAQQLPGPINGKNSVQRALSAIPIEYSEIFEASDAVRYSPKDRRKRPKRQRNKNLQTEPRLLAFVEAPKIEKIRLGFIEISRSLVINTAIAFHVFLM